MEKYYRVKEGGNKGTVVKGSIYSGILSGVVVKEVEGGYHKIGNRSNSWDTNCFEETADPFRSGRPSNKAILDAAKNTNSAEVKQVLINLYPNLFPEKVNSETMKVINKQKNLHKEASLQMGARDYTNFLHIRSTGEYARKAFLLSNTESCKWKIIEDGMYQILVLDNE